MFVSFVSQWLRNGPALRCFPGEHKRPRCQLDVNGVQPAGGDGAANGGCRLIPPDLSSSHSGVCVCVCVCAWNREWESECG